MKIKFKLMGMALAVSALLVACGGNNVNPNLSAAASGVRVFGDSLADTGAFGGMRFTVNAAGAGGSATPLWADHIATSYSKTLCSFYSTPNGGASFTTTPTCNNHAVGGGRINSLANTGGPTSPFSIPAQMDHAAAAVGGTFSASEQILLDGGGNDAADLFGAFLGANTQAGLATYVGMLTTLVPAATVNAVLPTTNGAANAGGLYMQALANKFADDITAKLLNRGARKVLVVNAPAITHTPRFKAVLAGVAQASGGGATGAAVAAQLEGMGQAWVSAFNAQLASRLGADARVAIYDLYTDFNSQMSNPSRYGLTNVTATACPATGVDGSGLPTYNFATCTAAALDASGPATWRTYAFSDGFHPTPLGHQIFGQNARNALVAKGWW